MGNYARAAGRRTSSNPPPATSHTPATTRRPVLPEVLRPFQAERGHAQEHAEVVVDAEEVQLVPNAHRGFLVEEEGKTDGERSGAERLDQSQLVDLGRNPDGPPAHRTRFGTR